MRLPIIVYADFWYDDAEDGHDFGMHQGFEKFRKC